MTLEQALRTIAQNACPIRKANDTAYSKWIQTSPLMRKVAK